ncbi:Heat shock protein beta-4 [Macaca fascicularis]|uniref:Alpha-crystallin A chain n=1 Tax=Macaca fascicularis TaxID=9541 RepID=G7P064_MACFA|nr:Heat shock protein beta-4 [Macaca fascicularis]
MRTTRQDKGGLSPSSTLRCPEAPLTSSSLQVPVVPKLNMDVTIQHPWFKRTLGPFYPSRLFDQFFGEGLFEYDLLPFLSSTISPYYRQSLFRTVLDSGISEVRSDRDKFVIFLDVKHFSPEDLTVKVQDDLVEIHGKHNERQDDHGYISREFHRRYRLPSNVDQSALSCSLSADGMLTFSGPKIQTGLDATHERAIPVAREEKPSSAPSS